MRKETLNSKKLLRQTLYAAMTLFCFAVLFLRSQPAQSDTKATTQLSKVSDFGAETIVPDPLIDAQEQGDPKPLPVALVEDSVETTEVAPTKDLTPPSGISESSEFGSGLSDDELNKATTVLNVTDAEIPTLIKTFSKLTRRNFIVDSGIKGKITIHQESPVTLAEALRIFDTVLLLKGYTTVPVGNNTWKVISAKKR